MNIRTPHLALAAATAVFCTTLLIACSKAPDAVPAAPAPAVSAGTPVADAVVTASVKAALLADPAIKSFDVQVETREGTVQLSGFVDNQGQIDQATQIARATVGASSVKNDMVIKP